MVSTLYSGKQLSAPASAVRLPNLMSTSNGGNDLDPLKRLTRTPMNYFDFEA